jgi:nucleoid-associated protein YgaU
MTNITVDPEFQGKIPPLTDAEYKQLEENIVSDGEIYEPIVVWNGVIVDGHNRWKIHLAHTEIPFRIKEMQFPDKWAAFDWMYRKQLGRRNLTDEQRTYLLGKLYESRKMSVGGDRRSADFSCRQTDDLKSGPQRTVETIAKEVGVGASTVERSERFSKGIDALKEVSPEAAQMVLEHKVNVPKSTIAEVRNMPEEERKKVAQTIERGEAPKKQTPAKPTVSAQPAPKEEPAPTPVSEPVQTHSTQKAKKPSAEYALIESVYNEMVTGSNLREYTVDDLIAEIQVNADNYVSQLRQTLAIRSTLLSTPEIRVRVRNALEEIQTKIMKVSDLV